VGEQLGCDVVILEDFGGVSSDVDGFHWPPTTHELVANVWFRGTFLFLLICYLFKFQGHGTIF
jgi:hypothetical protein